MTLALIDYGAGNLRSVENALRTVGAEDICVTADPDVVRAADRIVLPGVGAFAAAATALRAVPGLVDALDERVRRDARPFLGVCVGMQLMASVGEEHGDTAGLGWLSGRVRPLSPAGALKVPHMGWNDVRPLGGSALLEPGEAYFLHGFAYEGDGVLATTDHGGTVTAAVGRETAIGVQFHPEKSQRYGLAFLRRFLDWCP
ncbi:glutamine amidotransferase [Sphingomonas jejuensis]|uniref:Imidazole glycerol phosphate synthase subunit HisH n=1 Tax=Sphingomonas jejuensis TaxID=904715 RepID=A0ABX0XMR2_9SPHN|nr:imidazole glycerol phosphate synthase subunit HisH [Sphingomonas jejuensis]NJC34662.1 glutamine amidotransferase [Sphingomonas jejuensis]